MHNAFTVASERAVNTRGWCRPHKP